MLWLQAQVDVSGADTSSWTAGQQTSVLQALSQLTGSPQIAVAGSEKLYTGCSRRLLAADLTGVRLTLDICSTAGKLQGMITGLERLYSGDSGLQARTELLSCCYKSSHVIQIGLCRTISSLLLRRTSCMLRSGSIEPGQTWR